MNIPLIQDALTALQHSEPWLANQVAAPIIKQGIQELWTLLKSKLTATAKVEAKPKDPVSWEILRAQLVLALAEDPALEPKIRALLAQSAPAGASISQHAQGSNIQQNAVEHSHHVKISNK